MKYLKYISFILFLWTSTATSGHHEIKVKDAWARETPPGVANGAVYLTIHSQMEDELSLTGASADVAERTELHTHIHEEGVVKMRPVEAIVIPAKGHAMLKPGGDHIMLMGLKQPLKSGDTVSLELMLSNGARVQVEATVKKNGGEAGHSHGE